MRKIFSLLAAVLFAGSMMAAEATLQYSGSTSTNMVGDGANNAATVGLNADLFTVLADKGGNQNLPGLNKAGDIRLYADKNSGNGNTITVSIASGTITSIVLDIKQTATFVVKAGETAVTEENGAYAINATSFSIQNTTTGATTQLQLNKITITYTAEGGEEPVEPADPSLLFEGEHAITWDTPLNFEATKFATAKPGQKIVVTYTSATDGIEFKVLGVWSHIAGSREAANLDQAEGTHTFQQFLTENAVDSIKAHGLQIIGSHFTCTKVELLDGKELKEGATVWTGFFWADNFTTLELYKESYNYLDLSQYESIRFYTEAAGTDYIINFLQGWGEGEKFADQTNMTDGEGYKELALTDELRAAMAAAGHWMVQFDKKELAAFNVTDVVLVEKEPGDEPSVLQAVKDSTTWDFSKITANTANALYGNDGIKLTDESTPSKNDEVIYADYSEEFMTIGEEFNKAAIAFKGEYPIRKNKYCQAGTLHFKADVAGTIVVKFSDTGSSANATAVKRYLVVNDEQTEYWTSRENNGETPYDAQLDVTTGAIEVPAGDVTITGSSAIVVYYVTFVPEQAVEPEGPKTCAEAAEAALSVSADNELYNDGAEYTIEGYVTSIATAFNAQYGNISFWMADEANGGNVLQAYRAVCASEEEAPAVGDKVAVTGKLTKYKSTPEFAQGCTYVIVEKSAPATNLGAKTIAEFLALKNFKDTCVLTGVVANIVNNVYGNFDLCDEADTVYIYGLLTPDGQSKQFESLNVAEKDTLTVLAIYGEHNGKPQVSNAIFVEVKKAPVVVDTIQLSWTPETAKVEWKDATASQGWWQIRAWDDNYYITLSNAGSLTQAAGTYTVAQLDADYSFILAYDETDTIKVNFTEGSIEVADDGAGTVTVAGTLTGDDGNVYNIAILSLPDPYKYDEEEDDFRHMFESYEVNDAYVANSVLLVSAKADDALLSLYLILPQGQTTLTAGEYAVVTEPAYGTVVAGSYSNNRVNPSYAATLVEDGGQLYYDLIWYLVSGKVTVDENLNIAVDALNSKGKTIYALLAGPDHEAVENVETDAVKATKALRDGQLIIERNGVHYNVQGAVVR